MGHYERESYKNIEAHLQYYASSIRQPLLMYGNGSGSHYFESDEDIIADRIKALGAYLQNDISDPRVFQWGRTIFSESWALLLLKAAYPHIGLRLVPTDLDATRDYAVTESIHPQSHQKGADILLYQENDSRVIPLLLIDITLGSPATVKNKRGRLPLQTESSTPVATVALRQLAIAKKWNTHEDVFGWFLDHHGRASVYEGTDPQNTILHHAAPAWAHDLRLKMTHAIGECQSGLTNGKHQLFPFVDSLHEAHRKLDVVKQMLI